MILQALVSRYENTPGQIPISWQERSVDYSINIDQDGRILEIIPLIVMDGKRKIRRSFTLPEEPAGRTSGIKPGFLCDNAGYFFALDSKRGKEKFESAGELHHEVLKEVDTDAARAIKAFFHKPATREDIAEQGNYLFQVNGQYAHEDEMIADAWNLYRQSLDKGEPKRCLITGQMASIARLHGKVRLSGVSMGAVPFVSINEESFASYGNTAKDPAAQIGKDASFKYVTALNQLLLDRNHSKKIGQDTLVYWAEGNDLEETKTFSFFVEPQESDQDKLHALMSGVASGGLICLEGCDLKKPFYLLCLSPNAGRISVRFFHSNSFGQIINQIIRHYQNLEIVGDSKFPFIPPWMILSETTVSKKVNDTIPLLGGQLFESIITSRAYPLTLYHSILRRIRAGEDINRAKAAIIKAILIKNFGSEVATVSLNKDSRNVPYTLGRLFSVLEHLQDRAIGSSTIRQSYFSSASTNPSNVFPRLLSLSMHHADKLDNATWFEKQKGELIDLLDPEKPFPNSLSLQEQGKFIVGYYHQQQERYTKKEDK